MPSDFAYSTIFSRLSLSSGFSLSFINTSKNSSIPFVCLNILSICISKLWNKAFSLLNQKTKMICIDIVSEEEVERTIKNLEEDSYEAKEIVFPKKKLLVFFKFIFQ